MLFNDLDYSTLRPAGPPKDGRPQHHDGQRHPAAPFVGVQTDVADFMQQLSSQNLNSDNDYLEAHDMLLGNSHFDTPGYNDDVKNYAYNESTQIFSPPSSFSALKDWDRIHPSAAEPTFQYIAEPAPRSLLFSNPSFPMHNASPTISLMDCSPASLCSEPPSLVGDSPASSVMPSPRAGYVEELQGVRYRRSSGTSSLHTATVASASPLSHALGYPGDYEEDLTPRATQRPMIHQQQQQQQQQQNMYRNPPANFTSNPTFPATASHFEQIYSQQQSIEQYSPYDGPYDDQEGEGEDPDTEEIEDLPIQQQQQYPQPSHPSQPQRPTFIPYSDAPRPQRHGRTLILPPPGAKPRRMYTCWAPGCTKIYGTRAGLRYHVRTHHKGLPPRPQPPKVVTHTCGRCGKGYATGAGLRYHLKTFNHEAEEANSGGNGDVAESGGTAEAEQGIEPAGTQMRPDRKDLERGLVGFLPQLQNLQPQRVQELGSPNNSDQQGPPNRLVHMPPSMHGAPQRQGSERYIQGVPGMDEMSMTGNGPLPRRMGSYNMSMRQQQRHHPYGQPDMYPQRPIPYQDRPYLNGGHNQHNNNNNMMHLSFPPFSPPSGFQNGTMRPDTDEKFLPM
ncbi:hypothetical protein HK097_007862 [Rhizophlyctis rosea]|uniref:C2H2-type domain-containing protein n=1 Tax=Rhizophlyctis rosea TaxID=64517 RepID=A0AAD5SIW8_9FUNG|nr:hypothetical protein HK097_007862 [Rhizophlyctis rosea]